MKLEQLYNEVKMLIEKVDFNVLWPGFKPLKFALYNEKDCYFNGEYIAKTNEFLANTAIEYNGEMIAIWNVMEDISPIILTSKIIHEMYHGFQRMNNESRFPDELEAIIKYRYDKINLGYKLKENRLIIELINNFNIDKFNNLLNIMKFRYTNYPYEFIYETMIEQIEGSARYIELNVLKQLSYNLYIKELDIIMKDIINPNKLFPIRIISYEIGALLFIILKENNIAFNDKFNDRLFIKELVLNASNINEDLNYNIGNIIEEYNNDSSIIINNAIKNNNVILDYETNLVGFNVYNARYYNGYIISYYFVMYGDIANPNIDYGNFVVKYKENKVEKIFKF